MPHTLTNTSCPDSRYLQTFFTPTVLPNKRCARRPTFDSDTSRSVRTPRHPSHSFIACNAEGHFDIRATFSLLSKDGVITCFLQCGLFRRLRVAALLQRKRASTTAGGHQRLPGLEVLFAKAARTHYPIFHLHHALAAAVEWHVQNVLQPRLATDQDDMNMAFITPKMDDPDQSTHFFVQSPRTRVLNGDICVCGTR